MLTAYSLATVGQRPWDVERILADPAEYEGKLIFMTQSIHSYDLAEPVMISFEKDGQVIALPFDFDDPPDLVVGRVISIKGISLIQSEGFIRVEDHHVASYTPKVLLGFTGIVFMLAYFLSKYRFAPRRLLWESRTDA